MKQYNISSKSKTRRQSVIIRLEKQLESGTKIYGNFISGGTTKLQPTDIIRIKKELITLKSRV